MKPFFVLAFAVTACFNLQALAADELPAEQQADARLQSTYIWQAKPSFNAAYSGPNSLIPEREKSYTFSVTGFLGFRPWAGGELYFNPEMTQGVAFSNLDGLAGFTNGELTRVSGTRPSFYRQRLFLRQNWNRGGGRIGIDTDMNQLAGAVDRNRWVLTLGNFSTLDVFDDNAYAKDPLSQFMNWGNMTYAAYDYAADARGFGWGAALEWFHDDWVLRYGRMTGPKQPNMLPVDMRIGKHYGEQFEIEHDHELAGLPGKLRLLFWRDRANLASFADASSYLLANPDDPDHQTLLKVRNGDKFKLGAGVNIEQALNRDSGIFLRAMASDGRTETYAFTEADASFAAGLSVKGEAWGRSGDSLGLSWLANRLSRDRRRYLEAGGISFFIGDGALRYRPEAIFEAYYGWRLTKSLSLSGDYQHVANPAYNADRGPVNFIGMRTHTAF